MMKSLADRLIPGGHLVLRVPAISKLYNSIDAAVGHFRRYDKEGLGQLFDAAGLRRLRLQPLNPLGIPGWWWNGARGISVAPGAQIGGFCTLVTFLEFLESRLQLATNYPLSRCSEIKNSSGQSNHSISVLPAFRMDDPPRKRARP